MPNVLKQYVWVVVVLLVFSNINKITYGQEVNVTDLRRNAEPANRQVYIDKEGVVRWRDNNEELALFGVNYCLPSGYSYRAVQYAGADPKKVIDADITHLARMGLDAIRLSFWGDWENSDKEGNLIDNVHLELLDYVIAQASKRGIYMLLTPITLYSPVWPEPEATNTNQGFPRFYPRSELGINPKAIQAQQNYLSGILNHVNRYTKLAYKDDPAIVFIEPVNEPHHHPDKNPVEYIDALVKTIRDTGCKKPIFFNVSQDMAIAPALRDSQVDGATFGWYPSGLVNGSSLRNNFLSRVDEYRPMFDPILKNKPKLVYEFDAADIGGSYMYPAMARTYRSAGIQFAAMFSYDPLAIASKNLEYQTHYLNLVYTPNKAVSMMIASEAFHSLPRFQSYGKYPENTRFGPVRVSYEQNLSEFVTDKQFLYSNNTKTSPPNPDKLERIVGCGSSAVVLYEGTGVYFLEKLEPGVWRLEVYPDVVWVKDPFGKPSRDREVSRLFWRQHNMKITLSDLGPKFSLTPLNTGNSFKCEAKDGEFIVAPGVYLAKKNGTSTQWSSSSPFGMLTLGEYVVPVRQTNPISVSHNPPREMVEGRGFEVEAQVASDEDPKDVVLCYRRGETGEFKEISMKKTTACQYTAQIPAEDIKAGFLEYAISVRTDQETPLFPAEVKGGPSQIRQFYPEPVIIYDAKSAPTVPEMKQWLAKDASAQVVKSDDEKSVLKVETSGFDSNGSLSVEISFAPDSRQDAAQRPSKDEKYENVTMVIKGSALTPDTTQVEMILVDKYNMEQKLIIPLEQQRREYQVGLRDACISNLVSGRFAIGAWLYPGRESSPYGFEIEQIAIQPSANLWRVPVVSEKSSFVLFDAQKDSNRLLFPNSEHKVRFIRSTVSGMTPAASALRVEVPTFKPSPHDVSFRLVYGKEIEPRRADLGAFNVIRLRARGVIKETDCLELDFIQRNGTVRGTKVPLTTKWQDIDIPLSQFAPAVITFLPRPYPTSGFDYWDQGDKTSDAPLDLKDLEALQISFGSRMFPQATDTKHAIEVESIQLDMVKSN